MPEAASVSHNLTSTTLTSPGERLVNPDWKKKLKRIRPSQQLMLLAGGLEGAALTVPRRQQDQLKKTQEQYDDAYLPWINTRLKDTSLAIKAKSGNKYIGVKGYSDVKDVVLPAASIEVQGALLIKNLAQRPDEAMSPGMPESSRKILGIERADETDSATDVPTDITAEVPTDSTGKLVPPINLAEVGKDVAEAFASEIGAGVTDVLSVIGDSLPVISVVINIGKSVVHGVSGVLTILDTVKTRGNRRTSVSRFERVSLDAIVSSETDELISAGSDLAQSLLKASGAVVGLAPLISLPVAASDYFIRMTFLIRKIHRLQGINEKIETGKIDEKLLEEFPIIGLTLPHLKDVDILVLTGVLPPGYTPTDSEAFKKIKAQSSRPQYRWIWDELRVLNPYDYIELRKRKQSPSSEEMDKWKQNYWHGEFERFFYLMLRTNSHLYADKFALVDASSQPLYNPAAVDVGQKIQHAAKTKILRFKDTNDSDKNALKLDLLNQFRRVIGPITGEPEPRLVFVRPEEKKKLIYSGENEDDSDKSQAGGFKPLNPPQTLDRSDRDRELRIEDVESEDDPDTADDTDRHSVQATEPPTTLQTLDRSSWDHGLRLEDVDSDDD